MKKKLALLLACVMALSISAMPMSVFAASDNMITQTYPSLNDRTLLVGRDFSGYDGSTNATASTVAAWGDNAMVGTELTVEFRQGSKRETYFRLDLENAEWFFKATSGSQDLLKSMEDVYAVLSNAGLSTTAYDSQATSAAVLSVMIDEMGFGAPAPANFGVVDIREDISNSNYPADTRLLHAGEATFATGSGLWIAPDNANTWSNNVNGRIANTTYIGYYIGMARQSRNGADNIAYVLGVHPDRTRADVVLLTDAAAADKITIPLPIMTCEGDKSVTISVDGQTSGGDVSNSKLTVVSASQGGATSAMIKGIASGYDTIPLEDILITETQLGTIKSGIFHIDAPAGYKFVKTIVTATAFSIANNPVVSTGIVSASTVSKNGKISFDDDSTAKRLNVHLDLGANKSNRVFGHIVITGLTIERANDTDIVGLKLLNAATGGAGITDHTFNIVGNFVEYGVSLNKTSTSITTGRTETLNATVSPSNAPNKSVIWSSSKPEVATVANGVVTAVSAGTATITAMTVIGGKTANCVVTVTNASSGGSGNKPSGGGGNSQGNDNSQGNSNNQGNDNSQGNSNSQGREITPATSALAETETSRLIQASIAKN